MDSDFYKKMFSFVKKENQSTIKDLYEGRPETVDSIINEIRANKEQTEANKKRFISDIKHGIGEDIKKNYNIVYKVKKTRKEKIINLIKKIFTIF